MARRARRKAAPRPKHPRPKHPRTLDVPATHRATVPDATGHMRSAMSRDSASRMSAAPMRELALPALSASGDPGLAAVLIELAGVEHGDLRAALAIWQREQDRLVNRAWRRPRGLARPAEL
jgi:hypothetical protein